jgi:hypothetical protein
VNNLYNSPCALCQRIGRVGGLDTLQDSS